MLLMNSTSLSDLLIEKRSRRMGCCSVLYAFQSLCGFCICQRSVTDCQVCEDESCFVKHAWTPDADKKVKALLCLVQIGFERHYTCTCRNTHTIFSTLHKCGRSRKIVAPYPGKHLWSVTPPPDVIPALSVARQTTTAHFIQHFLKTIATVTLFFVVVGTCVGHSAHPQNNST